MSAASTFRNVAIERVKNYWDDRPCNIRHSPSEMGSRQYFDEVEARKYFVEYHIPGFAQFDRWAGKRVLEIGCGIGTDTMNFARAGASVTAVDLSVRSLEMAQQRARVYGLEDRIQFYNADAERLSAVVPAEPYDLVYSFGVIHHTPYPERVMEQIRQNFVAPGTCLKVMVYYRYAWKVLSLLVQEAHGRFWDLDRVIARSSEAQTGCPVTYVYSRREARQLLSGFHVRDMAVEHIFPYRIEDYVQYRYVKARPFRWLPSPLMRAMEHQLGWHLCVTAETP